nr:hypothetical protein [Tanacetum cinerariifolium]
MATKGQNHRKGENKQAYAPKPKILPPPKREDPAKDSICHECGETGHWKRNCPQYLAELLNKKKNVALGAGGSGIFIIELNTILYRSWIYDTGYGTHICNTTQGLRASRKLKPRLLGERKTRKGQNRIKTEQKREAKKRIKKLQHDGLLDSTDLRAFEKCVSCMSRKIARKPYTHQVERAKDLLGLIHTDEVENQLGKTIKSLRSDREGEYMSQEFLDHLKDYGIIAHRTPPYTLQHNGVSERGNRTLLDMVRSMMSQTTLPKSFWDYALETVARILNMVPTKKVEKTPYKDDLEIDEPQSDIVPIRRPTRTRHAPDRICLYIDAEEHELGDLGEPTNYKAALLDFESKKWLNVMNVEMQSMKENKVWVLVALPPNGKTIGSKCLFKKKTNMDGVVHTNKARLVVKGYSKALGIDYEKTFSPVVDIKAVRILIAIVAYYDYEIWQIDVKTAFLNGYLNEERYCMENSKRGSIHMQEKLKLSKSQGASTPFELKCMQNVSYASAVGFIMYDVRCTCPDVVFAQNVTSRFQQNPGDLHWTTVKNILKVSCYTDAGYLTDTDDLKSQTGYVFIRNGGAVDWKSAKQRIFATSSAEAEYIAAFDASKEAVWVRKFISGLGIVPTIEEPISMYCDNTRAIAIANESRITKGARHFLAIVHYLRKVIEYGDIKLENVHTYDNLADPFTKALAFLKHSEHTRNIGMLPASSLM